METSLEKVPRILLVNQHQWPLIARDIAMMLQPGTTGTSYTIDDIAQNYNLSQKDILTLIRLPVFKDILKSELTRLKSLGPNAGYVMRIEALVSDIQERLYLRLQNGDMDDKSAIQFLGMLMKSIGIDSTESEDKPQQQVQAVNNSVNISFNIPKLPKNRKLNHLVGQPQTNVVDYTG